MNYILSWDEVAPHIGNDPAVEKIKKVVEFPRDLMFWDKSHLADNLQDDLESATTLMQEIARVIFTLSKENQISPLLPRRRLRFSIKNIDYLLGGGLCMNVINELYGPAGSGKSQLAIHLTASTLLLNPNSNVLFISTQERFSIERLLDFLPHDIDHSSLLDRLHLQYFLDPEDETQFICYGLPSMAQEFDYKLIIYDGIASNARIIESAFEKAEHINQVIGSFRKLMLVHECALLITNQITDIPGELVSDQKSALGLSLDNNVNIKLAIEHNKNTGKRCLKLVKSLFTPLGRAYFTIETHGIKGLEEDNFTDKMKNFFTGAFAGVFAGIYISQNYEVIDIKSFVNGFIKKIQEYEKNKRREDE